MSRMKDDGGLRDSARLQVVAVQAMSRLWFDWNGPATFPSVCYLLHLV